MESKLLKDGDDEKTWAIVFETGDDVMSAFVQVVRGIAAYLSTWSDKGRP